MPRIKLDRIDRKILSELQADGRMTNVDLAKKVGISAPPCLRRVKALEDEGFIKNYHAEIDPAALGFNVTVFAFFSLDSQAERDLHAFRDHMINLPEVRECYMLAGETDFLVKAVAKDWDAYQLFLQEKLLKAPHVKSMKSSLLVKTDKYEPGVPIDQD